MNFSALFGWLKDEASSSGFLKLDGADFRNLVKEALFEAALAATVVVGGYLSSHDIGLATPIAIWSIAQLSSMLKKAIAH